MTHKPILGTVEERATFSLNASLEVCLQAERSQGNLPGSFVVGFHTGIHKNRDWGNYLEHLGCVWAALAQIGFDF